MCARKYMFGDKSTYLVHAKMIKTKKIRIKTKKLPCNLLHRGLRKLRLAYWTLCAGFIGLLDTGFENLSPPPYA